MRTRMLTNLTISAMGLAFALILPFLTGQIPQIGSMLLPMHLPVLLCGLICGWQFGFSVGIVAPLLRSLLFGMPVFYPVAIAMTAELGTYGLLVGLFYLLFPRKSLVSVILSLCAAMIAGRAVWGCVMALLLGLSGKSFPFSAFVAGAFTTAVPGIILQLILIPSIMYALDRMNIVRFNRQRSTPHHG